MPSDVPSDPFPQTTMHVRGACSGDAASVDWLVARFTPLLIAQARYRLRGRMAAICDPEDVVNDVWLAVLPKLHRIQPRNGRHTPVLVSYLGTTVLNRVNTLVMKHLRGKPRASDQGLEALPAVTQSVVSRAVRAERKDAVLAAIEQLDEGDREVVVLGAIEQQPRARIAEQLGVTTGALRVRLHRALQRLREQLPGSVFDELDAEDGEQGDDGGRDER
ncbi:MAG: sigma-70 family RNA polymerase sigma factor [Planctomycetes bacterium]|nr:sigma-70 family RNA polymerase sigma factor [Planctomycetota bacterium]